MNHIYRVVWNHAQACWTAVAENAKGQSKSTKKSKRSTHKSTPTLALITLLSPLAFFNVALAAPTGGVVSAGTATIAAAGTTTTITQTTPKAAIDWGSFSVTATETVNFAQPSSSAITLNRVTGTSASSILGKVNANGQVFILNPNGVLFGNTAQVNVGGLVASTLSLSNADLAANNFNFVNTANNKSVENKGKITVPTGGTIALIAPTVKHSGTITAPQGNVLLAAAGDVTLSLNNGSLVSYTINQGKAQALINSGGLISASVDHRTA